MSHVNRNGSKAFYAAAITIGLGVVFGINSCDKLIHPASDGADYLAKKEYSVIGGGNPDYFNLCAKGTFARQYKITNKKGDITNKTVCFGLLGPYLPIFSK